VGKIGEAESNMLTSWATARGPEDKKRSAFSATAFDRDKTTRMQAALEASQVADTEKNANGGGIGTRMMQQREMDRNMALSRNPRAGMQANIGVLDRYIGAQENRLADTHPGSQGETDAQKEILRLTQERMGVVQRIAETDKAAAREVLGINKQITQEKFQKRQAARSQMASAGGQGVGSLAKNRALLDVFKANPNIDAMTPENLAGVESVAGPTLMEQIQKSKRDKFKSMFPDQAADMETRAKEDPAWMGAVRPEFGLGANKGGGAISAQINIKIENNLQHALDEMNTKIVALASQIEKKEQAQNAAGG
jgi:hypothetical protein